MAALAGDTPVHCARLKVANYYALRVLPQAQALVAQTTADNAVVMAMAQDDF